MIMRTFKNSCAQGDVMFRRVDRLPNHIEPVAAVNGELIVTHSETGHHHVMVLDKKRSKVPAVEMFSSANNPLVAWIRVNRPTSLDHRRPHDTHESIMFEPGLYEVRRQREYTPEGWRQVMD